MYQSRPNLTIGFHGCDETVRNALVINPDVVEKSQALYDWLGNGFYIWENNYQRAYEWALDRQANGKIITPSVVGVVYQLDYCLDFTDSQYNNLLPPYYDSLKEDLRIAGKTLPKNKDIKKDEHHDLVIRELDCAVIEYFHRKIAEQISIDISKKGFSELKYYDTVRGIFTEGGPIFDGAGLQRKNHIQICIRNLNCIKGFFIPRTKAKFP